MAKTATAAFPQSPAHVARDVREQGRGARQNNSYRNASIEERTAVLETRWAETVPTLATSRDISDLRGEMGEIRVEMRNLENRLIKWVVGAGLALLAVVVALFTANTARIDKLDAKIDARFDALMAEIRELRK